jgi:ankyrin repeat protein
MNLPAIAGSGSVQSDKDKYVEDLFRIVRNYYKEEPNLGLEKLAEVTHDKIFYIINTRYREALEDKEIDFEDIKNADHRKLNVCNKLSKEHNIPLHVSLKATDKEFKLLKRTAKGKLKVEHITDDLSPLILGYALAIAINSYEIYKDTGIFPVLIEKGANISIIDKYGSGILHFAVGRKDLNLVELLLAKKVPINICNSVFKTPLGLAASLGELKICKSLIENGADVNFRLDNGYYTPLMQAALGGKKEVCNLLLSKGANPYLLPTPALHIAVDRKNISLVQYFLDQGLKVDFKDDKGTTALLHACIQENIELIKLLLSKGATDKLTLRDTLHLPLNRNGSIIGVTISNIETSVLTWAVRNNKAEVVKAIIKNAENLDINVGDKNGESVLIIAIKNRNFGLVKDIVTTADAMGIDVSKICQEAAYVAVKNRLDHELCRFLAGHGNNKRAVSAAASFMLSSSQPISMDLYIALTYLNNPNVMDAYNPSVHVVQSASIPTKKMEIDELEEMLLGASSPKTSLTSSASSSQPTVSATPNMQANNLVPEGKMEIDELEEMLLEELYTPASQQPLSMGFGMPSTSLSNTSISAPDITMEEVRKRAREEGSNDADTQIEKRHKDNGYSR